MSSQISLEEAQNLSGYLEKKSRGVISSWQKRFFQIVEGKNIIYKGKEKDKDIKGTIFLDQVSMPESVEKKVFKFKNNERDFLLKAKSEEEKNKWINAITILKNKISETGDSKLSQPQTSSLDNMIRYQGETNIPDLNSYYFPNTNANSNTNTNVNNEINDDANVNIGIEANANSSNSLDPNINVNININPQFTDTDNKINPDINEDKKNNTGIDGSTGNEAGNNLPSLNSFLSGNIETSEEINIKVEPDKNMETDENNNKNETPIETNLDSNKKIDENQIDIKDTNIEEDKNINIITEVETKTEEDKNINPNTEIETKTEEDKNININPNTELEIKIEEDKNININPITENPMPEVDINKETNSENVNENNDDINKQVDNPNPIKEEETKPISMLEDIINNNGDTNTNNQENNGNNNSPPIIDININVDKDINPIETKEKTISNNDTNVKEENPINTNINNEESILEKPSLELLKLKGIDQLLDIADPKIGSRIFHNYIYIKDNENDNFQKRWFILFSPRPLFDKEYKEEESDLDPKMQKDWLKFDTLYYFKYESSDENNKNSKSISLVNREKIEIDDKDGKYYLYLNTKDKKYDFYCNKKEDRDILSEVLKNSSRTAKEYEASITKHPRNIELLNSFYILGNKDYNQKMEKEKSSIIGDYNKIKDYDELEIKLKKLCDLIESTLDGCNANIPQKDDLLKTYPVFMNNEFLQIIKSFWDKEYKVMNIYEILNMSIILFDMWEKLYLQNVYDPNFFKNGKALTEIYIKKTYKNILAVIETILTEEREKKALKDKEGKYYTKGPNDLFELLTITFESIKDYKNIYLYESILNLFYYLIRQYLLGVATVLTNPNIIIEKEFLLAIANNVLNFETLINNLLDEVKKTNILTEEEIKDSIKLDKINVLLNGISQKSITSFICCFMEELGHFFKNVTFISLDMSKIVMISNEILTPFSKSKSIIVTKKAHREILKLILYHYIILLFTLNPEQTKIEQIRDKIKKDIDILNKAYESIIGDNLTLSTIKILNDILDFFNSSPNMISSTCLPLREYIGSAFNLNTLKDLINLRTDLNEQDKNDALKKCKEVIDNYKKNNNVILSYFLIIEREKENETKNNVDEDIFNSDNFKYESEENKDVILEEEGGAIYEGFMDQKIVDSWENHYYKLKNGFLYCYNDKNSKKFQSKISINNIIKTESNKEKKFILVVNCNFGDKKEFKGKIYKFSCETNEEKNKWINLIEQEMKNLGNVEKDKNIKLDIPIRKKVITDYFELPAFNKDINYMRKRVLQYMKWEKYFKPLKRNSKKNAKAEKAFKDMSFEEMKIWFINKVEGVKSDMDNYFSQYAK